jgi:geranylgeranyl pyrophosphate synthase
MHRLLEKTIACPAPEKLGTDLAIIAGDIVYALAIDAFLSIKEEPRRKERALKYFIQTAAFTAMGEFVDTVSGASKLADVSEKDVFLNYALKTARYTFDCPLVTGAILAGAPERDIKKLAAFGLLIGEAFQIQDDIIGIFETEAAIGKSILSDLEEQKKTILMVHAARTLKGKTRRKFDALFLKPQKTLADLKEVQKILVGSGSLAYALAEVRSRSLQAQKVLSRLTMAPASNTLIRQLLFKLFERTQTIAQDWKITA